MKIHPIYSIIMLFISYPLSAMEMDDNNLAMPTKAITATQSDDNLRIKNGGRTFVHSSSGETSVHLEELKPQNIETSETRNRRSNSMIVAAARLCHNKKHVPQNDSTENVPGVQGNHPGEKNIKEFMRSQSFEELGEDPEVLNEMISNDPYLSFLLLNELPEMPPISDI